MGYLDATNYGSYNQKTSAANSTNSTSTGNKRLTKVLNGKTYTELDLIEAGLKGGFTNRNIALLLALDADKAQEKPNSNDVVTTAKNNWTASPKDYKFNLPPHQWSIPLRPVEVDSTIVSGANGSGTSFHGLRRGRIWYWNTSGDITQIDSSTGETVTAAEKVAGTKVVGGSEINLEDRKYAFQFLWNPESISVNVARNMDITPSAADALRVVTGVFPGQETVSLNLLLDRTNDFACIKHASQGTTSDLKTFETYYLNRYPNELKQDFATEMDALLRQGTLYDLEYLFRAVNGSGFIGPDGKPGYYTNLLNRVTANIGYLQPTLLGIELGPTQDNLSYVGWISNLSMNHTKFTETMIPLQTQVSISIECFSGSGIGASK
jgi:hypothetical protein